jgi:hypothetical protein
MTKRRDLLGERRRKVEPKLQMLANGNFKR